MYAFGFCQLSLSYKLVQYVPHYRWLGNFPVKCFSLGNANVLKLKLVAKP